LGAPGGQAPRVRALAGPAARPALRRRGWCGVHPWCAPWWWGAGRAGCPPCWGSAVSAVRVPLGQAIAVTHAVLEAILAAAGAGVDGDDERLGGLGGLGGGGHGRLLGGGGGGGGVGGRERGGPAR